jgi:hypothetical protein
MSTSHSIRFLALTIIVGLAVSAFIRPGSAMGAEPKIVPSAALPKSTHHAKRYPVPFPPQLPDGQTVLTLETDEFLKPGPTLREGVEIAKVAPKVDFVYYPGQDYPGNPWSHRSDGIVVGDVYYTSSNDHLAPVGTAHLWAYNGATKQFRHLCDTAKFLESQGAFPPDMNYRPGEMQSRIDLGSDGRLYYCTDRGSPTVTHDGNGWKGEWILATDPKTGASEIIAQWPVDRHTMPCSLVDSERDLMYVGTATGKNAPNQKIQFFVLDLKTRKIRFQCDDGPYRVLFHSPKNGGKVYWEGKCYDPATNQITPANVPNVRSATRETPQGLIYGTSSTKADLWSYNPANDELKQLGNAAVGTQEYISSIEVDPTGRYLYYVPGAHGGAVQDDSPIVQFDLKTGRRKVLAFLYRPFWEKCKFALDGSFGNALDEKGERFFISWDGRREGHPKGPETAAITVVYIPEAERRLD